MYIHYLVRFYKYSLDNDQEVSCCVNKEDKKCAIIQTIIYPWSWVTKTKIPHCLYMYNSKKCFNLEMLNCEHVNIVEKFHKHWKTHILPANLPRGIVSSIGFAFAGSDHPNLPISVMTTVGLTAFTLI